jgi:tRNA threonylcarbamoyl adenosine modification protein (Sua5/YciO/YrdC/YwlC family)
MKVLSINPLQPDASAIEIAAKTLRRGGVIIYPTDTCYGIGADARNPRARERIVRMKQRDESKKFSIIVKDIALIEKIAFVDDIQRAILKHYLPGQFTFILMNTDLSILNKNTIGVRIPKNIVTQDITNAFDEPFISTSANIVGQPVLYSYQDINDDFLQLIDPNNLPDLVLDAGVLPHNPPSTVVNLVKKPPITIREGATPFVWPLDLTNL